MPFHSHLPKNELQYSKDTMETIYIKVKHKTCTILWQSYSKHCIPNFIIIWIDQVLWTIWWKHFGLLFA